MATAVEASSQPTTPRPPASLPLASLAAAGFVVAAAAAVLVGLPTVWATSVAPALGGGLTGRVLLPLAQFAAAVALVLAGRKLFFGPSAPRGVRGGIFLMISAAVTIFFLWRAVAMNVNGPVGMAVSGAVGLVLLYIAVRFFTGRAGAAWMVGLEDQGWFSTAPYKRTLGQKVRRLTVLGLLLVFGSGIYALSYSQVLPADWTLRMPFEWPAVTVLRDANTVGLLLLVAAALWVAFRAVNVPPFGEFLIATEAEMNKVSWTPRKRLFQDTVVVLVTTVSMTLFLLVVDLFWGWLLSRQTVGVLPGKPEAQEKAGQLAEQKY